MKTPQGPGPHKTTTSGLTTIVKVQTPLSQSKPHILVYDKDRKHVTQQDLTDDVVRGLAGRCKGYFSAIWEGDEKGWNIHLKVRDQNW